MKKTSSLLVIAFILSSLSCGKGDPIDLESEDKVFSQDLCGYYYNPPTIVNNHIFIGTSHKLFDLPRDANCMFKLDADLNKIWEYSLGYKEVRGSAALDSQGNIYFVVQTGHASDDLSSSELFLYSLTSDGQTLRWQHKIMDIGNVLGIGMITPAITIDDKILVAGDKLHAFDMDGNLVWSYLPEGFTELSCLNAPIIDNLGNIYFNYSGGSASIKADGSERWNVGNWGGGRASAAFTYDYSCVIMPRGNTVFCFDASTGDINWQYSPPGIEGSFRASPAVDDEGNVYVGTKADDQSVLYAIKADGSDLLWSNDIGADLYSSPALGNDRILYIGSESVESNRFHAISMATGEIIWSKRLNTDITWSSPAIASNGMIYIGCMPGGDEKGYVYAFKTDAGGLLSNAGSARFHGSNANNGRR